MDSISAVERVVIAGVLFLFEIGRKVNIPSKMSMILSEISKFRAKSQMLFAKYQRFSARYQRQLIIRGKETVYCGRIL